MLAFLKIFVTPFFCCQRQNYGFVHLLLSRVCSCRSPAQPQGQSRRGVTTALRFSSLGGVILLLSRKANNLPHFLTTIGSMSGRQRQAFARTLSSLYCFPVWVLASFQCCNESKAHVEQMGEWKCLYTFIWCWFTTLHGCFRVVYGDL